MKNVLILCTGNAYRSQMAEALGTAFLLAAVVGAAIKAKRLAVSETFAGIRLLDAPGFIVAKLFGAFAANAWLKWLIPTLPLRAEDVMLPNSDTQ